MFYTKKDKEELRAMLDAMLLQIGNQATKPDITKEHMARVAELEVKMAKLWSLLMEVSQSTGKEKLSRFGRRFGGKSQNNIAKQ